MCDNIEDKSNYYSEESRARFTGIFKESCQVKPEWIELHKETRTRKLVNNRYNRVSTTNYQCVILLGRAYHNMRSIYFAHDNGTNWNELVQEGCIDHIPREGNYFIQYAYDTNPDIRDWVEGRDRVAEFGYAGDSY